jgi:uncharacterized protein
MDKNGLSKFGLEKLKSLLGEKDFQKLTDSMKAELARPPKVAVIGKSGVGKSSTINSLFNLTEKVSHVDAGTLEEAERTVTLSNGVPLTIVDMPGLGEDLDRDREYEAIYKRILPQSDLVLYVVQADLKALSMDQRILRDIVSPIMRDFKDRLVVGLNQVDKIGPGDWNSKFNRPSPDQEESIDRRCKDIRQKLKREVRIDADQIEYYSATKRYRLFELLAAIIRASGKSGWKLPIDPSDPVELADPSVQGLIREHMAGG